MMPLKYLSQQTADALYDSVAENLELYKTSDFNELADGAGKSIALSISVDLNALDQLILEKGAEADIDNSLIIWNVFNSLKPSLACENRLWTRLSHVECLEYSKARWLDFESKQDDVIVKDIRTHLFANTQTKYRDDNAISRLWWSAYIAKLAAPNNQEQALRMILKTTDIRSNYIERTRTSSRPVLAVAIVKLMMTNSWVCEQEINFREFMKTLNRLGGGKVFEMWSDQKIDEFMNHCFELAEKSVVAQKTSSV